MIFFSTVYWFRYIGWLKYILVWPSIYQFVQRHIDWLIFFIGLFKDILVCSTMYWFLWVYIGLIKYAQVCSSSHGFAQVYIGLSKYIGLLKKHIGYISLYTFIIDVLNYWSCDKITIPYHMTTVMWSSKKYKPIK